MKRELNIAEARKFFKSEKVFATNDGGFLFNDTGKYRSGLTFVINSSFELDQNGEVISPIHFVADREVTDSFNLDLDGDARFLFGDFWRSRKGAPCFRPKDPAQAKHLLVRVDWGGSFNRTRGYFGDAVAERGAIYFRRASSNGGGSGYDYWVLPVGYVYQVGTNTYRIDHEAARAYCAKYSRLQAEERADNDRRYREKLAIMAESKAARDKYAGRLLEIEAQLSELRKKDHNVPSITLGDEEFSLSDRCGSMTYSAETLADMEEVLSAQISQVARGEAVRAARQKAYTEVAPHYLALQDRAHAVQLEVVTESQDRAVLKKLGWFGSGSHLLEKEYTFQGVLDFEKEISKKEAEIEAQRAEVEKLERAAAAKAVGLPSDIRIWKRVGSRTGCSQGWVIAPNGVERERDSIYNENSRRAARYDEGYEIWNQILPGELVVRWSKDCTAAEHQFEIVHCPETVTDAQRARLAELQEEIEEDWRGCTGLTSGIESPSIGAGWLGLLA